MRKAKLWALAGLPVLLAACAGDDADMDDTAEVMTDAAVPVAEAPMADMGMMAGMVTMQALDGSGVSGEATITPEGADTQVMVRLTGLTEGEHPGHIHSGTCDAVGGVVQPLQPITVGADGTGTMTTTVALDPNTVMNGQHVIQYHQAGGGPGVVCGPIPAHAM